MPQAAEKGEEGTVVERGGFVRRARAGGTQRRRVAHLCAILEKELAADREGWATDKKEDGEVPFLTARRQGNGHIHAEKEQIRDLALHGRVGERPQVATSHGTDEDEPRTDVSGMRGGRG